MHFNGVAYLAATATFGEWRLILIDADKLQIWQLIFGVLSMTTTYELVVLHLGTCMAPTVKANPRDQMAQSVVEYVLAGDVNNRNQDRL